MKKIMLVFGTRPEAIKMAPLVKALEADTDHFETVVCVTGQHRQMLDQVLDIFNITPRYDLDIMRKGQDLYDITSRILLKMRDVLAKERPDLVLVHGDTTTSTTTALAAFYQQIPVGHIEAGLRTHNIYSPWPEEVNRQLTARIATYHFVPTTLCKDNLLGENISNKNIYVTGNTVIDAMHYILQKQGINHSVPQSPRLILITAHRRENFGKGLENICNAIKTLVKKYPDVDFVYSMHPNPAVRKPIADIFGITKDNLTVADNLHFCEPLEYTDFVTMMAKSTIVLTDSGGIQEEAPGLGKPVLVMRNTTERTEALKANTVKLVGTDPNKIVDEVSTLLDNREEYNKMSHAINPYGDGHACQHIIQILRECS